MQPLSLLELGLRVWVMFNFGVYIHVPWCYRRCPYCDFYFEVAKPQSSFADTLFKEWEHRHVQWPVSKASTLYFGGGTPSLLAPAVIDKICNFFIVNEILIDSPEVTMEVNPEDISEEYADKLAHTAVNRISMGVQSFNDNTLRLLGRKHKGESAKSAIDALLRSGFNNISIDLILGVPGQSDEEVLRAIDYIASKGIKHVSTYLLTIEEGTAFQRFIRSGRMKNINDDAQVEQYLKVQEKLRLLDFVQYDVSSFAKDDCFSIHNQIYWAQGHYIGLGPHAHSMRLFEDGSVERYGNQANVTNWLMDPGGKKFMITEKLSSKEALKESLAFGLRNMLRGVEPNELAKRHGQKLPKQYLDIVGKYKENGWLAVDKSIRLTANGALFADAIMRDILACDFL